MCFKIVNLEDKKTILFLEHIFLTFGIVCSEFIKYGMERIF